MEIRPILIIGALQSEINILIEKLNNCEIEINGIYKFYRGIINN